MTKKISEKLFDKLSEMGLKPTSIPKRLIVGYWQRSNGAWRWSCDSENGEIGSQDTMKECLDCSNLEYSIHNRDIILYAQNK